MQNLYPRSEMNRSFLEEKAAFRFGASWLVGTTFSGAIGHFLTMQLGFYLFNSGASSLLAKLFTSLMLINSVVVGLFCASLFQGWLLAKKGIAFWPWIRANLIGYVAGIIFIYTMAFLFPLVSAWSLIFAVILTSILQARQLSGHVQEPYAWPISFIGLTFLMNILFIGFYVLAALSGPEALEPNFATSLTVGVAIAIVTTHSLMKARPKFKIVFVYPGDRSE